MASFVKRGKTWRVQIRKSGQSHSASFPNKAQAVEWATKIEAGILAGKLGMIPDKTFGDAVERYIKEVVPGKRGSRPEKYRLLRTVDDALGKVKLTSLRPEDFSGWRDRRLQKVSPASVLREWGTLANVCNIAVNEWRWLNENPMRNVKRPVEVAPRQRVITQDEIDRIVFVCGDDYSTAMGRVGLAFQFAIETAMRAGEICGLTWEHVFERHVHLPTTKNGHPRDVPLSDAASLILSRLPKNLGSQCFGITPGSLDALFRRAKVKARCDGFTFHDARRTALTRLAKLFQNVLDLARISGHRDLSLLLRVYYAPDIADLSARMQSPHPQPNAGSASLPSAAAGSQSDTPPDSGDASQIDR